MCNPTPATIQIQVCYARPDAHFLRDVCALPGVTLQEAIHQSDILHSAPEIDLAVHRVGVYGKLKSLDSVLRDGDRVEIYRPLIADPKDSRRQRAEKKRQK